METIELKDIEHTFNGIVHSYMAKVYKDGVYTEHILRIDSPMQMKHEQLLKYVKWQNINT